METLNENTNSTEKTKSSGKYAHLTEKEKNQKLREIRKRVAKIKPIYDNNDHYELEVARSRGELPDDQDPRIEENELAGFEKAIKQIEYEIKKETQEIKNRERRLTEKKLALKQENQEMKNVKKQIIEEEKLAKQKRSPAYRAEKLNLSIEEYKTIKTSKIHLPSSLTEKLHNKIELLELTKAEYLYTLVKNDLEDENCSFQLLLAVYCLHSLLA